MPATPTTARRFLPSTGAASPAWRSGHDQLLLGHPRSGHPPPPPGGGCRTLAHQSAHAGALAYAGTGPGWLQLKVAWSTGWRTCLPTRARGAVAATEHGAGAFVEWQPRYAEVGIATFPVNGKTPAIRGYLRVKPGGSLKLVERFPSASAFGLALKPSGIAVVDVDTPDERCWPTPLRAMGTRRSSCARERPLPGLVPANEGRYIRPDPPPSTSSATASSWRHHRREKGRTRSSPARLRISPHLPPLRNSRRHRRAPRRR